MKIIIINGPNLNLLGKREPEVYGSVTFETYFEELKNKFPSWNLSYFQSNIEGELIDKIFILALSHQSSLLSFYFFFRLLLRLVPMRFFGWSSVLQN
jgi:3-dehydroquinate dehydratase-2